MQGRSVMTLEVVCGLLKEKLNREHPCSISHPRQEDFLDVGQAPEATKVKGKKLFGLHRSVSCVTADFAGECQAAWKHLSQEGHENKHATHSMHRWSDGFPVGEVVLLLTSMLALERNTALNMVTRESSAWLRSAAS